MIVLLTMALLGGSLIALGYITGSPNDVHLCPRCRKYRGDWRSRELNRDDDILVCGACGLRYSAHNPPSPAQFPRVIVAHGPQVVGMPCAVCGDRIVLDSEATPCPTCAKPVHIPCLPHLHGDAIGPYRR